MTLTFTNFSESNSNLTTYTFSSMGIGTAAAGRDVIAGVWGSHNANSNKTVSSVTIGGVSATELIQDATNDGAGSTTIGLFIARVPTGTTADVVVTFSTGQLEAAALVWTTDDLSTDYIGQLADSATAEDTPTVAVMLDVLAGDYVVAMSGARSNPGNGGWTGVTERHETAAGIGGGAGAGADATPSSDDTTYDVDMTWTSSATEVIIAIAMRVQETGFHPGRPMMITG